MSASSAKTGKGADASRSKNDAKNPPERDGHFYKSLFERFDIDPRQGPRAITERLRELAEEAPEHERNEIRAAWEELTLHPMRRLRAAFAAHPESRPPLGAPPPLPREPASMERALTLGEIAARPSVARAFGVDEAAQKQDDRGHASASRPRPREIYLPFIGIGDAPSLEDDPILKKGT